MEEFYKEALNKLETAIKGFNKTGSLYTSTSSRVFFKPSIN